MLSLRNVLFNGFLSFLLAATTLSCSDSNERIKTDANLEGGATPDQTIDPNPKIPGLGVSKEKLISFLGGKKGILVWIDGQKIPKMLDFRQADPQVKDLADETDWVNPLISPDGTRLVYSKGLPTQAKSIMVRDLASGDSKQIATGDIGYWNITGNEEAIIYCDNSEKNQNGADGKTYRLKLVKGEVNPDGQAEILHQRAMDAGPNKTGEWLGQVYSQMFAYNVSTKKEYSFDSFVLQDGTTADHQTCNGSMAPDATARLMTLVIPHDYVRIYTYNSSEDKFKESSRFLLPTGMAEWEFPEWSTDPDFYTAILMKADRKNRLFIAKIKEGEVTPELLEITGENTGASYSHLYLE